MKKKILMILMMLITTSLLHAFPKVYPSVIEMNIDKGRSRGEFSIFNSGEEVKKYKLGINENDNLGKASEFSKYLKVFPKYVEVQPGANQKVRVFAKGIPKDKFDNGEVRAAISVEEIKPQAFKKYASKKSANGVRTMIDFNYVLNMAVYGYVGNLVPEIEVKPLEIKDGQLLGEIKNMGNYSYPLDYEILNKKGKVIKKGPLGKILFDENLGIKVDTTEKSFKFQIMESNKKDVLYTSEIGS